MASMSDITITVDKKAHRLLSLYVEFETVKARLEHFDRSNPRWTVAADGGQWETQVYLIDEMARISAEIRSLV